MLLKKCKEHGYTSKEECSKCGKKTEEAHYKFLGLRDVKDKKK